MGIKLVAMIAIVATGTAVLVNDLEDNISRKIVRKHHTYREKKSQEKIDKMYANI